MTLSRRDSELLLFDQLYQASTRGSGAVLLISGAVGTGKTALLQAMVARAGRQGGRRFLVTGSARELRHPFGVLDRLVQSMCVAGMADPFPGGVDAGDDFFMMMDRLVAAFHDFADGRPVIIGIDDLHFADEQSLRCLSYLIRRVESSGVVIVLTESSPSERDLADLRAEMLPLPFCHRLWPTSLTSADIAEQLRERFGAAPDAELVQQCAQTSGGVPLLLHALVDDLAARPGPGTGEPGVNFRQAVLRSLHRCASSTAAVAQAIAVLGDHAASELIVELGGVDAALLEEGIRDLREMGLLEGEWFRHPAVRSAVLAGIPLRDRPEMHSRAAELLRDSGASAMAVAEQLIAAQDGARDPWRVTVLCEAAREAMAAGEVDSAVTSLRHAVAASSDEAQRARVGVQLADALWHADPGRAARRLGDLGQDARAGLLTGPDIRTAVNQFLWWGEFAEAGELLELAGADGGDAGLSHLWAFFGRAGGAPRRRDDPGRPDSPPADTDSPPAQSGPMAAAAYVGLAASLALDGVKTDRADQMLLGVPMGTPIAPALHVLVALVQAEGWDEAIAWCDRLLKEDWINRVPMRRVMIETVESAALLRAGAGATSLRRIEEVLDAVPPPAWGVVAGLPLSVAVRASTDLGDAHSARSYLAVPVPPAMFDTPFALPYLQALARYHLTMGQPECARMHARSCAELIAKWGLDSAWMGSPLAGAGPPRTSAEEFSFDIHNPAPPEPERGARLTYAERRVAALAADGITNREIAERLFITVSTVEQHLTKIYRKLDVHSRSGLRRHRH